MWPYSQVKALLRFAICFFLGGAMLEGALAGEDPSQAWRDASSFLFKEAGEGFRRPGSGIPERERKLGEGLVLLNTQPRSQANIQKAIALFQEVARENATDDLGLIARLSEARAAENHLAPADPALAEKLYTELLAAGRGHPVAELAAARLVIGEMYDDVAIEEINDRARRLAPLAAKLETKAARANFHYTLGMALVEVRGDSRLAEEQLQQALSLGMLDWQNEGRLLVALGSVAEANGDLAVAEEAYERFVKSYRRDKRTYAIKERLEKVRAQKEKSNG